MNRRGDDRISAATLVLAARRGAVARRRAERARRADAQLLLGRMGRQPRSTRTSTARSTTPGAAIMDAWWPRLAVAVLQPVLGPLTDQLKTLAPIDDPANPNGSSYGAGWYCYVDKDLRTLLGQPVPGAFSTRVLRRRRPLRLRGLALAVARRRRQRARRGAGLRPGRLARRRDRGADPLLRLPPGHDALDEPPDVPAGDRVRLAPLEPAEPDKRRSGVGASTSLRFVPEKHYLFTPGPDARAAAGARRARRAGRPPPRRRLPRHLRALPRPAAGGLPHARTTCCSSPPRAPARWSRRSRTSVARGSRAVVVSAGNFGERWARSPTRYGADVEPLRYEWGETPEPTRSRAAARARRRRASCSSRSPRRRPASSPTSRRSRPRPKEAGALVVVDAISSLGAVPLETDAWGLDVVVSGSQKALMTPPGLGARAPSRRPRSSAARRVAAASTSTGQRTRKAQANARRAVHAGRRRSSSRSTSRSACCSTKASRPRSSGTSGSAAPAAPGVKAMGLELFSPDEDRSAVVTAVRAPDGDRRRRDRLGAARPLRHHDRGRPGRI